MEGSRTPQGSPIRPLASLILHPLKDLRNVEVKGMEQGFRQDLHAEYRWEKQDHILHCSVLHIYFVFVYITS